MKIKIIFSLLIFWGLILIFGFYSNRKNNCLYLRTSKIFDGLNESYLIDKDILIENSNVISIHDRRSPPRFCPTLDLFSFVVLPGLIDSHTHLLLQPSENQVKIQDVIENSLGLGPDRRLEYGKKNALSMLKSGFTYVRDLGNSGNFLDARLSDYLFLNPLHGPTIQFSGPGLAATPAQMGKFDLNQQKKEYRIVSTSIDIENAILENVKQKATWLKLYADNDPEHGGLNRNLLQQATQFAHKHKMKVAVHTTTKESAEAALQSGADSLEHFFSPPEIYNFHDQNTRTFPVYFVINNYRQQECKIMYHRTRETLYKNCHHYTAKRSNRTKQGRVYNLIPVFGSDTYEDFNVSRGKSAINALASLQEGGLSAFETLQTAGINAAKLLGITDQGIIKKNSLADIIAVKGDPLKSVLDLKNVVLVVKGGKIVCDTESSCHD